MAGQLSKSYVCGDLNAETKHGTCGMFNSETTNIPPITTNVYGVWFTARATYASGSGLFLIQFASTMNGEHWMRTCWNNDWTDWSKIG